VLSVGRQADMSGSARTNRRRGARTGMYFGIVRDIEPMVARRKEKIPRDRKYYTAR